MKLAAGKSLSHYEILGELGAGGMGEVYRARDTRLGREVAIKVLPEGLAEDAERLQRFEREARTLACLSHSNVAQVYGIDQVDGACFMAMELVPGEDLARHLSRGALPVEDALEVCRQVAEGLEAAHDAGVIHRDLKPANVILTPEGNVKLLDFGLAKPITSTTAESTAATALTTGEGRLLGTPGYMAPEQVRGKPVDRRVDVWAFGCVLYECLTGRQAFAAGSLAESLAAVLHRTPDLALLPARSPARVRALLERCLDKDPRTRLRDVGEARIALGIAVAGEEPAVVPERRTRAGAGTALGAFVLGGLATLLVIRLFGASEPADPLYDATWSRLTDFEGTEFDGCVSPNGNWVSFVSDKEGEFDLYTWQVEAGGFPVNRTRGSNQVWIQSLRDAGFTADSSEIWLAGGRGRTMKFMPLGGGEFRPRMSRKAVNIDWTTDGNRFVYHTLEDGDPLYVGSGLEDPGGPILEGNAGFHQHYPTWSFDDQRIFVVRGRETTGDTDLWWIRPDGTDPQQLTEGLKSVRYPAPIDERTVVFVADDRTGAGPGLWVLDLETLGLRRGNVGLERYTSVSASADGRRLVATVSNPSASLFTLPIQDGPPVKEADVSPFEDMPSLRALVPRFAGDDLYYFSSRGTGDGLWRLRGKSAEEIWDGAEQPLVWPPALNSDGSVVALVLPEGPRLVLSVMNTDGSRGLRPLVMDLDVRGAPCWSPDDRWIAIGGSGPEGGLGLFKIHVESGDVERIVDGEALHPVWSPRNDLIVFTGPQITATAALMAVDPAGEPVKLPAIEVMRGGERYRFLPGGSGLVYMQGLNYYQDFHLLDLDTLETTMLADLEDTATMRTFDVTPDGKALVFDRERPNSDIVLIERD